MALLTYEQHIALTEGVRHLRKNKASLKKLLGDADVERRGWLMNADKVKEIRQSSDSYRSLSERYGISIHSIADIKRYKTWRDVK